MKFDIPFSPISGLPHGYQPISPKRVETETEKEFVYLKCPKNLSAIVEYVIKEMAELEGIVINTGIVCKIAPPKGGTAAITIKREA